MITARKVNCAKLGKELDGLNFKPIPGPLGDKIYESISQSAWQAWLKHQTTLINEYRLNLIEKDAKVFLLNEMEKFLFGTGSELPPGYKKQDNE